MCVFGLVAGHYHCSQLHWHDVDMTSFVFCITHELMQKHDEDNSMCD